LGFDVETNNLGIGLSHHKYYDTFGCSAGDQTNDILDDGFRITNQCLSLNRITQPDSPVPEPTTIFLFATSLFGLVGYNRKKIFK